MNYDDHVAAVVASAPPLTRRQLHTIAANLAQHSGPGAHSAKNCTGAAYRLDRYSIND